MPGVSTEHILFCIDKSSLRQPFAYGLFTYHVRQNVSTKATW